MHLSCRLPCQSLCRIPIQAYYLFLHFLSRSLSLVSFRLFLMMSFLVYPAPSWFLRLNSVCPFASLICRAYYRRTKSFGLNLIVPNLYSIYASLSSLLICDLHPYPQIYDPLPYDPHPYEPHFYVLT